MTLVYYKVIVHDYTKHKTREVI